MLNIEILSNSDCILTNPLGGGGIAHALLHHGGNWLRIRELTLILFFGQVFSNKAPLSIRATRVLDRWVHVDAKAVTNPTNLNVLVKRIIVAVLSQQADIPFAVGDLVLTRRVIRHIRIRDVLYMAHQPVKYLSDLDIRLVVNWDYLPTWSILALIVGNLSDVLGEFVDGEAGSCVDGLTLDGATGGEHVGRPLPLVVWTSCVEP